MSLSFRWMVRFSEYLLRSSDFPMDPSWSPDSSRLVWHAYPNTMMPWDQSAILIAGIDGGHPVSIASGPRIAFANARFSPDGTRIVCVSDRSGALNVSEISVDGTPRLGRFMTTYGNMGAIHSRLMAKISLTQETSTVTTLSGRSQVAVAIPAR